MATAEELLRSITSQPDPEGHIVVGGDRFITVPDNLKRLAVQYDHNMETVTFSCPRYWDDRDMSKMAVYINYMLSNGYTDRYPTDNVRADGDVMHFDWTISRNVSQVAGAVSFLVCVMKTDPEGNEERHWNSELCQECYVSKGMETEETAVEMYPDEVTQLLLRMATVEQINVQAEEMQALHDATVDIANAAEETKNQALDASGHIKNSYASTIKVTKSGEMIHTKDVSPIEHDVKCLVHGKNLCNLSVLPIHDPSDPAVYISNVGTDYIEVTSSPTYDGNGHVHTSVRLKELCPQMRAGKTYILSGMSDAWNKCIYLRALDYFWQFDRAVTVTQEMIDCTVGFYGYAPYRGQDPGVCRISNIQIEEGSVATAYEPYVDPTSVNVSRCGKNMLSLTNGQSAYGVTINVDANEIVAISGTSTQGVNIHVGKAFIKAGRKYKPIIELYSGKAELKYWDEAIGIQTHPDADGYLSSTRDSELTVFIYAAEAGVVFNGRFKVMLVLVDGDIDETYEKYTLSTISPSSDGSCTFTSTSPIMTLYADTPGVTIEAEYNADTKTWIENMPKTDVTIDGIAKVSQLENDAGYTNVDDVQEYLHAQGYATKAYVRDFVSGSTPGTPDNSELASKVDGIEDRVIHIEDEVIHIENTYVTVDAVSDLFGQVDELAVSMGDIETALDSIIAMQNSLIGGNA